MSTKILAGGIGLIVLGVITFYVLRGSVPPDGLPVIEGDVDIEQSIDITKNQFEIMRDRGQSMKCDFFDTQNDTQSEGVFYFDYKNNKTRVDVTSTIEGRPFSTHMVNDGEHIYTWGTDMEQGTMMSADVAEVTADVPFFEQYESLIRQQQETDDTSYTCIAWSVKDEIFVPDATVEFIDMSDMMEGLPGGSLENFDPSIFENLEVN